MRTLVGIMLFLGAVTGLAAAQSAVVKELNTVPSLDLGVMYVGERSKASYGDDFWLQGASAEAAFSAYKRLGVALNVTGASKGDVNTEGKSVSKVAFVAGPRYSQPWQRGHGRVYVEALFGGAHGFDGIFPAKGGAKNTANAFAMQAGGGWDVAWKKHWTIRAIEVDYVRTHLPNGYTNVQNNLKLGAGVLFRLPSR